MLYQLWTYQDLTSGRILAYRVYCLAIAAACLALAHLLFERRSTRVEAESLSVQLGARKVSRRIRRRFDRIRPRSGTFHQSAGMAERVSKRLCKRFHPLQANLLRPNYWWM